MSDKQMAKLMSDLKDFWLHGRQTTTTARDREEYHALLAHIVARVQRIDSNAYQRGARDARKAALAAP